jgi:hypothetical protein
MANLPGRAGLMLQNATVKYKPRLTRMNCCSFGHLLEQWAQRTIFDEEGDVSSSTATMPTGPGSIVEVITQREKWGSWSADCFREYWDYTRDPAESVLPENFTYKHFVEWIMGPANAKTMKDVDRIIMELQVEGAVLCRMMPPFSVHACWEAGDRYPRTYVRFDAQTHHIIWDHENLVLQPVHEPAAISVAIATINRLTAHHASRKRRSKTTTMLRHVWDWQSATLLLRILDVAPYQPATIAFTSVIPTPN